MHVRLNGTLRVLALAILLSNIGMAEKIFTVICRETNDNEDRKDFTFDIQFEGFSNHGKKSLG